MSPHSTKPIIFISYAHLDEPEKPRGEEIQWLTFVMKYLRPAVKRGEFTVWVDRQMYGGTKWDDEIQHYLRFCDVFVLLVSPNSTGSAYIIDKELQIARERQAAGDDLHVYPLLLKPTAEAELDRVRDFNLRPMDAKPLSEYSLEDRSRHMSYAADEIAEIASQIARRKAAAAPRAPAASAPSLVYISALPETGYERLVGRGAELRRLDAAWSDDKTNILSLIAEGGAGKSALVNEWLMRLQADSYRGADCVLGWSFYSQGSKERATAADEFLNWALAELGVNIETTSASAKGEALAETLMSRRALILLDGVEPLQYGPGPQMGQLKDQGLRALLRRFAAAPARADHSLIVLTSRLSVADIKRFKDGAAPVIEVEKLSDEAGAELLRDNEVWGIEAELRAAAREFGGHPLALVLLASLLKETQNGDARRRDHIRGLLADPDNPGHDHARRVMESHEKEWLAGQPVQLAILHSVGLFDRPASGDCLEALRSEPPIPGLTDALVNLSNEQWRRAVARLVEVRLLAPADPSDPEALDAHPLVREWFGERLRATHEVAWKAAHSRLYDHLRETTREGHAPTLADLAPLYHAIVHGCRAGRHQEALVDVYRNRICRRALDGEVEFYSKFRLGAFASDLSAIAWFFDVPYEVPAGTLSSQLRAWVIGLASFDLRAQGRLKEAIASLRAAQRILEEGQNRADRENASTAVMNLSETELVYGDVVAAVATAERSVMLADGTRDALQMTVSRSGCANALHAAGEREKAARLIADAQHRQRERQPNYPLLYGLPGYSLCDLLLSEGRDADAREHAAQTLPWAHQHLGLLAIALNTLALGRAHLSLAVQGTRSGLSAETVHNDAREAAVRLEEAVEHLRAAAQNEYLACGLFGRAAFRRAVGDWDGAARDLHEVEEIAEPGPMRLCLCDCALERARLALARRAAFAPLNGLVEPSAPRPTPDAAAAALKDEARKQLDAARKLIAECGYHRRDEEWAELDAVVAGRRRFADLPPRV